MKKLILSLSAFVLAAMTATAAVPVKEAVVPFRSSFGDSTPALTSRVTQRENTFFEGFEGRLPGFGSFADDWLPEGWSKFSKADHTLPTDNSRLNLLWRVTDNDNKNCDIAVQYGSYEGECFAHIITDAAKEVDGVYIEPEYQDEWLVTPAITPVDEDWLYFKLNYYPSWTTYNREQQNFTARNNDLDIYVSTDNGENWIKIWNLIDDEITSRFTDEQLREDLINLYPEYRPIYVNIKDYVGREVKFAFRFFGRLGQGMALDNVEVGIPMPVANYTMPAGVFMQQMSAGCEYPVEPSLLAPYDTEISWHNTSTDVLRTEWTYEAVDGTQQKSEETDLVTPGYDFGTTHMTPELVGYFESRVSDPFHTNYPKMQTGNFLTGTDGIGYTGQFAVGGTDVFDGEIKYYSEYMCLNPEIDLAWEKIMGYLDGALDVYGFCSVYQKPAVAHGFDFLDIMALVRETVPADDGINVEVYSLDDNTGWPDVCIGKARLSGDQIPEADPTMYVNLRFNFPVPVNTDKAILIVLSGCRDGGNVSFPCVITTHPEKYGNNLVYWLHYDPEVEGGSYEEFKNLGTFPVSGGRHFGGLLTGIGVSYSTMERLDSDAFEVPIDGASKQFKVRATRTPDTWKLTEDGVTELDWLHFDAEYDAVADLYNVTLTADANDEPARGGDIMLVSPGSYVTFAVNQLSGIASVSSDVDVFVKVDGDDIVIIGDASIAEVYDITGKLVASTALNEETRISGLADGVYVVRIDGNMVRKVVK